MKRSRYRRAMYAAIKSAAQAGVFAASSRTDGLRAIRLFERVNSTAFDPSDRYHVQLVTNSGWHFALQRKLRRIDAARGG